MLKPAINVKQLLAHFKIFLILIQSSSYLEEHLLLLKSKPILFKIPNIVKLLQLWKTKG